MRRGRIFIFLALIIVLGLAALFVIYQQFLSNPGESVVGEPAQPEPITRIAVITQFASKGTILDESIVNLIPWQQDSVAIGMFPEERLTEVLGRQVKYDLQAGTPVLETMLLGAGEQLPMSGSSWAMNIPTGMVAVSIPIDRLASVSFAPRPGDHVDVIASLLFVDVDTDFQTMLTVAVVLRYARSANNANKTWTSLRVRIVDSAKTTVLAGATSTLSTAWKTVASSITTTTPTNSGSSAFTYVNTGAS
ncbi:MAG: Flp pilus assembly protein CpaB, partial [Methanosarcinaceae archaeon]|nr:Flp pilus assembly protein CpaB [Methanosarcinaceae archaeon]